MGEMNSAGPGRPDISMYFFVRPNALSATQLVTEQKKKVNIEMDVGGGSGIWTYL